MSVSPSVTDGSVTSAQLAPGCRWPLLNEAAVRTIRDRWRFGPGPVRYYEVVDRFYLERAIIMSIELTPILGNIVVDYFDQGGPIMWPILIALWRQSPSFWSDRSGGVLVRGRIRDVKKTSTPSLGRFRGGAQTIR